MSRRNRHRAPSQVTVADGCRLLETLLHGGVREEILAAVARGAEMPERLARLRRAMRSHVFPTDGTAVSLGSVVNALDARTKNEGFHVLESWDFRAHRFADQIVPVLMLDRCASATRAPRETATGVLLDQYFLSILGLLVVRAWDEGDPNDVLDRVTALVRRLGRNHGESRYVDDAETLLILAVSHYHPHEAAYDVLLERVRGLDAIHRRRFALACAPVLGCHLRWGLRFMYKRDAGAMRDDNVVDYPWLLFAVGTLLDAYDAGDGRDDVADALLSGITADPWALTGKTPACLQSFRIEHQRVRDALVDRREKLLAEFEPRQPHACSYSPLGLEFNFLCNALVAMVDTAMVDDQPHPSLNDLFTSRGATGADSESERYARALMAYASGNASPGAPALIMYDRFDAQHSFNVAKQVLSTA